MVVEEKKKRNDNGKMANLSAQVVNQSVKGKTCDKRVAPLMMVIHRRTYCRTLIWFRKI